LVANIWVTVKKEPSASLHRPMKTRPRAGGRRRGDVLLLARDLPHQLRKKQLKPEHGAGAVWTDASVRPSVRSTTKASAQFLLLEMVGSFLKRSLSWGRRFRGTGYFLRLRCALLPSSWGWGLSPPFPGRTRPSSPLVSCGVI
jgi:hypothetical protein